MSKRAYAFLKHNTKLPNRCLSSSEMVSLCSVAASDFPGGMPCCSILRRARDSFPLTPCRTGASSCERKFPLHRSSSGRVAWSWKVPPFFILRQRCKTFSELLQEEHKRWWGSSRFSATKKAFRHTPPKVFEGTVASMTWKRLFHAPFKSRNQWPRKTFLASWPALQVELIFPRKRQQRLSQRRDKNFWRPSSVQWAFYLPFT